jgi:hypothetical protein
MNAPPEDLGQRGHPSGVGWSAAAVSCAGRPGQLGVRVLYQPLSIEPPPQWERSNPRDPVRRSPRHTLGRAGAQNLPHRFEPVGDRGPVLLDPVLHHFGPVSDRAQMAVNLFDHRARAVP